MLLVVTYSRKARESLRNIGRTYEETVVRSFGRAALLSETELGAFLALRLQEKYAGDVQIERTEPLNEFADVPAQVRDAARAYEAREQMSTPYRAFVAGTDHPTLDDLRGREL